MEKVYIVIGDESTGVVDVYLHKAMADFRVKELESDNDGIFYHVEEHEVCE